MERLEVATLGQALPPAGAVPEWVHLLPTGLLEGRDGRNYVLPDPETILSAFAAHGADLVVDYEHQSESQIAKSVGPVRAAGWIKELKAEESGIWGRVEWTTAAQEMIATKEYRYLSPVIQYRPEDRAVMALSGAGLVHRPNLRLTALNAQDAAPPGNAADALLAELTRLLGLPAETSIADALRALADKLAAPPDPKKFVPVEAVQAMMTRSQANAPDPARYVAVEAVQSLLSTAATERAAMAADRIKSKVDQAAKDGFITHAMRAWATDLCTQSEASFDAFCEKSGPVFAHLLKPHPAFAKAHELGSARSGSSPEADEVCRQLGLKPGTLG